ncbi:hypothetical protein VTI28DRAFT_2344 [Corynascus sepedonium]
MCRRPWNTSLLLYCTSGNYRPGRKCSLWQLPHAYPSLRSHTGKGSSSEFEGTSRRSRLAAATDHVLGATSGEEHTFTITGSKTLRRFHVDGGGAHVFTGYFDGDKEVVCLAKIYDGVYYPFEDEDSGWDCMTLAEADYAIEAWAYRTMQPVEGVGAKLVPEYHGTWTFAVVTNRPDCQRWVRMLLLELVHGETVLDKIRKATKDDAVQYSLLPDEDTRLRVLKDTFEAEISILWNAEVLHEDLSPRNVMVQPDGSVVIIDFNRAVVYPFYYRPHPKYNEGAHPLPDSPIRRHWPFFPGVGTFADPGNPWASWVPQSWLKNPELAAEWLLET